MVRTFSGGADGSEGPEEVIGDDTLADFGGENPVVCIATLVRAPLTRYDLWCIGDIYDHTLVECTADNLWVDNFLFGLKLPHTC